MGNQTSGYFITYKSAVQGPEYDYNPKYNQERIFYDYTGFYVGIGICALIGLILIFLNLYLGCFSKWKKYWNSWGNSGNRFILPIFVTPPKDQEPILF